MDKQQFIDLYSKKANTARKEWTRNGYIDLINMARNTTREGLEAELVSIIVMCKTDEDSRPPVTQFFQQALKDLRSNPPYSQFVYPANEETFDMQTSEYEARERQYALHTAQDFEVRHD